eukprot:TRINITY_DN13738_c0_g1_i1.p1 TRINITY_DN13738_c0_g1~~TRINITY_DN13738_c0_g1_i1.p1  ORF type:complete len:500 (+),score=56.15 TRINITY_DN13738_c0_g1_i1:49-1548(+)
MVQWVGANQSSVVMCSAAVLLGCVGLMLQGEWLRAMNIAALAGLCFSQSTSVDYKIADEKDRMSGWDTWWIASPSKTESMGVLVPSLTVMQLANVPTSTLLSLSFCSWLLCGLRVADRFSCAAVGPLSGGVEIFITGGGIALTLIESLALQSSIPLWSGILCVGFTVYSQAHDLKIETTNLRVLAPFLATVITQGMDSGCTDRGILVRWSMLSAVLLCPVLKVSLKYVWTSNKNELLSRLFGQNDEEFKPASIPAPSMNEKLPSMDEVLKKHEENDKKFRKHAQEASEGIPERVQENLLSALVLMLIFVIWFPWVINVSKNPFSGASLEQGIVYVGVSVISVFSSKIASVVSSLLILFDSGSQGIWLLVCLILLGDFIKGDVKEAENHPLFPLFGALVALWYDTEASSAVVGALLFLGLLQMMIGTTKEIEVTSNLIPKAIRFSVVASSLCWLYSSDLLPLLSISLTALLCHLSLHPQWLTLPHLMFFLAVHSLLEALV